MLKSVVKLQNKQNGVYNIFLIKYEKQDKNSCRVCQKQNIFHSEGKGNSRELFPEGEEYTKCISEQKLTVRKSGN